MTDPHQRVLDALTAAGLSFEVTRHAHVTSLAEAAAARGIEERDLVKTLVVRRAEGDHVFVLVPGDRTFSWPKLRAVLGVTRVSMPDAATALAVTGFERGTITPFGSLTPLPVYADETIGGGLISLGVGLHDAGVTVDADAALVALHATRADLTDAPD